MVRNLMPFGDRSNLARSDDPFGTLRRELTRMFDEAFGGFLSSSGDRLGAGMLTPPVDVHETDNAVELTVELPGVDEKDIQVTLEHDLLTIKGEKRLDKQQNRSGYHVSERAYGSFYRSLALPAGIDPDKVEARFAKGVLTIVLPKLADAQARTKRIEVKGETGAAAQSGAPAGQTGSVEELAQKAWDGAKADTEGETTPQ